MEKINIYSAGEFLETSDILNITNPFNGEIFAETYLSDEKILENSIQKALNVEAEMKNMPSFKKYEILQQIAFELKKKRNHFGEIICKEAGKPIKYALGEVDRAVQTFIIAAEECKRLPKEYISLDWTAAGQNREGLIKYFPVGLIAGIAPFNFPLNLAVHKIAPAIASGCPIILKPASSTPLSTLKLAEIIDKTELPKGAFSVLPMNRKNGNLLVTDNRFKLLTFTGSPEVGWQMKKDAGKKKVVLELGGNAGLIISSKSDINHAIDRSVIGGFAYSGQVCIHTQRILVEDNVFDEFSQKFIKKVRELKFGDPMNMDTDISSMIDEGNAIRVENWVNEAVESGAKLLCGGKRNGTYYEPTVLTNTGKSMKVCSSEIFGPVVTLEKYTNFKEAVNIVNQSRYGLQAGLFSDSDKEINFAFRELNVGGLIINDVPTFRVDHMPYGGVKDSGIGREGVKYAIHDMMEAKVLVKDY